MIKTKKIKIVGIIFGVLLINLFIINFYLENREKESFTESCWYIMDKYPNICVELEEKARMEGRLSGEEAEACPCKTSSGIPLNMGPRGKFFEGDKNYVGEGCIYHKECEKRELEGYYYYDKEYDHEDIKNVDIELRSPTIIRKGNIISLIVDIKNTNKKTNLVLEKIRILNFKNEIVHESIMNQKLRPVRKDINKWNNIQSLIPYPLFVPWFKKIVSKLDEGSFKESYQLDIENFSLSSPPEVGENVYFFIEIGFSYDGENFIKKRSHSVLVSTPLPKG